MRKAVVDVGSNSVLLLVEEQTERGWQTIRETTQVSSLGAGTRETGLLGEEGIQSTLAAIRAAFGEARELGVESPQAAVTMAARIASNTDDFLARCIAQHTPVFVMSGEQEAELGFRAVARDSAFESAKRISIIDVGGQSTELVTADRDPSGWTVSLRRSYPIGTLALLGGPLKEECPTGLSQIRACQEVDDTIGLCYLPGSCGSAVCLGATGTNLISIRERLATWRPELVHGATLSYEEISKAVESLFSLSWAERASLTGIEPGREETLPIGALILERFLFALRTEGCAVSVRGWRHGLLEYGLPGGD